MILPTPSPWLIVSGKGLLYAPQMAGEAPVIPGPPRVLTIDVSGNILCFEHDASRDLHSFLKTHGIEVAYPEVLMPKTLAEFGSIGGRFKDFNTLLLITHGKPGAKSEVPSHLTITEESLAVDPDGSNWVSNWFAFAALSPCLRDKLLCLIVCDGMCPDMKEALVADGHFALVAVAPIDTLNYIEATSFYQQFFLTLYGVSKDCIDPEQVLQAVKKHNSRANCKMRVFSEVFPVGREDDVLDSDCGQSLQKLVDPEGD